jgi:hypothetical protein
LIGGGFVTQTHAAVANKMTEHVVSSLDNLVMAVVQKNDTIKKLVNADKILVEMNETFQADNA